MSVNKTDYVVVGIDIINQIKDMSDESFEYLESLVEELDKLEMIYDGMSGEYCMICRVLRKVEEDEEVKPFSIHHINLDSMTRAVEEEIESNLFPMISVEPFDVKLKVFSYYH